MGPKASFAEINREATRLAQAAGLLRREAGGLRYHPSTGLARHPGPDLDAAVAALRESVAKLPDWIDSLGGDADPLRRQADQLRVALDVLAQALARPERAPLDAPYGLGTPRRPHPGAQATWAAERAESLARALARLAVVAENAPGGLRDGRPTARPP
ncbi:MAG TPA: hypothetical protein VGR25_13770 [bacterium]|jgi:hypothetical protein|nr:hypothetical protein [bacterium]